MDRLLQFRLPRGLDIRQLGSDLIELGLELRDLMKQLGLFDGVLPGQTAKRQLGFLGAFFPCTKVGEFRCR